MAIQTTTYLKGKINGLVFYERSGVQIARVMGAPPKQTGATKKRSKNFGIAATLGKELRPLLLPAIPFPKSRSMQGKFSGAFSKWMALTEPSLIPPTDYIPFVREFQFNPQTSIAERFKMPLIILQPAANELRLQIPAFIPRASVSAPANTVALEFTIAAASGMFSEGSSSVGDVKKLSFPYNDQLADASLLQLLVATTPGSVVITAISLGYRLADGSLCSNPSFMPSSIIDARFY